MVPPYVDEDIEIWARFLCSQFLNKESSGLVLSCSHQASNQNTPPSLRLGHPYPRQSPLTTHYPRSSEEYANTVLMEFEIALADSSRATIPTEEKQTDEEPGKAKSTFTHNKKNISTSLTQPIAHKIREETSFVYFKQGPMNSEDTSRIMIKQH